VEWGWGSASAEIVTCVRMEMEEMPDGKAGRARRDGMGKSGFQLVTRLGRCDVLG
jgi:hypothetical protein